MNRIKNKIIGLSSISAALMSPGAMAVYPGTNVGGYCSVTTGLMAAPANVEESQSAIMSTLQDAAKVLHAGQLQQIASQKNLLNQQTQEVAEFLKNLYAAKSAVRYLSNTSAPNQPQNVCNEPSASASLAAGEGSRRTLKKAMETNIAKWNEGTITQYAANVVLSKLKPQETTAAALFDPSADSTSTSSDANTYIGVLVAPKRPLIVTPDQAKTVAGMRQKVESSGWQLQTGYATDALTYIASLNQPVIKGSDFVDQWHQSGKTGNPPGYNTATQTISPDGALSTQVRSRYASPTWYQQLNNEGQSGVLREITQMTALDLKQQEVSLKLAEHLASISAVSYSQSIARQNSDQLTNNAGVAADQSVRSK